MARYQGRRTWWGVGLLEVRDALGELGRRAALADVDALHDRVPQVDFRDLVAVGLFVGAFERVHGEAEVFHGPLAVEVGLLHHPLDVKLTYIVLHDGEGRDDLGEHVLVRVAGAVHDQI